MRRVVAALVASAAALVHAGPVEVYRDGPELCPRDLPKSAPVLTEDPSSALWRAYIAAQLNQWAATDAPAASVPGEKA